MKAFYNRGIIYVHDGTSMVKDEYFYMFHSIFPVVTIILSFDYFKNGSSVANSLSFSTTPLVRHNTSCQRVVIPLISMWLLPELPSLMMRIWVVMRSDMVSVWLITPTFFP